MRLIVGLGNTGKDYGNSRHNAGFLAVRWLAKHWQAEAGWTKSKLPAYMLKLTDEDVLLAQPTTMMNESGLAVRSIMDYYKLKPAELVVIHDDADLELGDIRSVASTSTGAGHHGVLSVLEHIGTGFRRVRIGIGRPEQTVRDIADYVLGRLTARERAILERSFEDNLLEQIEIEDN